MDELLSGAPVVFLAFVVVIGGAFVAMPTWFFVRIGRDLRRRRTWTPLTGTITATQVQTTGAGSDRRVRVLGRYSYRDPAGVDQTGSGDVNGAWMPEEGGERRIELLVDPADHRRSMPLTRSQPVAMAVVGVVMAGFALIGLTLLLTAGGLLLG